MISKNTFFPHALLAASATVVVFLGWYLFVLLGRTELLARGTSLARDTIVGFHVLGILAVGVSAFAQRRVAAARYGWAILASACVIEIAFFLLNWFGPVWGYRKGEPDSLYEAVVQFVHGLVR